MDIAEFELRDEHVELNQLLKLVGLCPSGGAGKMLVAQGRVRVNGVVELRKTCKVCPSSGLCALRQFVSGKRLTVSKH